jgi:hypothetical protein
MPLPLPSRPAISEPAGYTGTGRRRAERKISRCVRRAADPSPKRRRSRVASPFFSFPGLPSSSRRPRCRRHNARPSNDPPKFAPYAQAVAEAARRFAIPERWIWAVMRAESGGDPRAVSPKGAMGLMQIMPATWAELRARHGLGTDPYDPRDNIFAGAAYLREMRERYGAPGLLAAYHAGPGRYDEYLAGRPLPAETLAYVATLAPLIGSEPLPGGARNRRRSARLDPLGAVRHARRAHAGRQFSVGRASIERCISATPIPRDAPGMTPRSNGLFVARAGAGGTP